VRRRDRVVLGGGEGVLLENEMLAVTFPHQLMWGKVSWCCTARHLVLHWTELR